MNEIIEKESIKVENVNTLKDYNLRILGNTEQDGTPTPENPVNIRVVTGEQEVEVYGKNMLDSSRITTDTINGITLSYDKDTQIFTLNGTCTQDNTLFELYDTYQIHYKTTKFIAYYISGSVNAYVSFRLFQRDFSINISLNLTNLSNTNKSIMQIAPTDFVAHSGQNSLRIDNGTTANNFKFKLMLTDSDDTEWEPYQGSTYPLSLNNIELCKIGDYQDYIYKQDDKWWKHKEIEKVNNPKFYYNGKTSTEIEMINDQFSNVKNGQNYILNISNNVNTRNYMLTFRMPLNLVSGSTEQEIGLNAETYINSKTIIAYYILNTPIDEQITDSKLISQLNNLNNAILYSGENNIITTISPLIDGEGTSINLTPTIKSNIYDIKLKGNTTQNGTPTPDNPVNIRVVTGNQEIKVYGKNMLDSSKVETDTQKGITLSYDKDTQIFTLNGTCTADNTSFLLFDKYSINQNKTKIIGYYISGTIKNYIAMRFFKLGYTNSLILDLSKLSNTNKIVENTATSSFIASSGTNSLRVDNGTTANNFKFKLMLTDSDDTEWKPYQSSTYPLSLGNMELCKIGDYQDYIYKQDDKWFKHKEIDKIIFDGNKTPDMSSNGKLNRFSYNLRDKILRISKRNLVISDKFNACLNIQEDSVGSSFALNNDIYMYIDQKITTTSEAQEWFKKNNPIFYFACNPIEQQIIDTTLITQLNNLSKATTYAGETNIVATSDGNNLPVTNYIKAYSSEIINESYPYLDLKYNLPYTEKLENLDFYLNENGRLVIKNVGTYLCSISESEIPDMPEASETTVKIAGRDGDLVLATTYNPIQFSIVIYTDENLSPAEKIEERQKIYKFFHEMKNTFKTFGIEAASKFYRVKYAGDVECENHPKHLKFTLPFKSSVSYGYNFKDKELIGNNIAISNTIEPVGFKCIINGPATNPTISLNNNEMKYEASIVNNEKIIIDTNNSTVTSITDNNESNAIVHYNRVFPKIQNGKNELKILSGIDNPTQVKIEWNDYNL